eukprot:2549786-Lingulodinium_polyedra.AAC.1
MMLHDRGSCAGSSGDAGPGERCAGSCCPLGLLEPGNNPAGAAVHGDPFPLPVPGVRIAGRSRVSRG